MSKDIVISRDDAQVIYDTLYSMDWVQISDPGAVVRLAELLGVEHPELFVEAADILRSAIEGGTNE